MKITPREMLVAAIAQFQREESIATLARRAGMQQHSFLYALRRLESLGVLRPWVFVNPFKIGYEEIELLFTVGSGTQHQRAKLKVFFQSHSKVIWYGSLGGSYQFGVRIIAKGPHDCQSFLDEIDRRFPSLIARKSLVHILSFSSLPKRYLNTSKKTLSSQGIEIGPGALIPLDEVDYKILQAFIESPLASEREIARITTYARATVTAHIKKLKTSGVLIGSIYRISARALGFHAYRILVYGRGLQQELEEKISQFIKEDLSVVNVTRCLGAWDYELSIEVQDPAESAEKVSALYAKCGSLIEHIELLPVFEQNISNRFLSEQAAK